MKMKRIINNFEILDKAIYPDLCNHGEYSYILTMKNLEDNDNLDRYYDIYYYNSHQGYQICVRYGGEIQDYLSLGNMERLSLIAHSHPDSLESDIYAAIHPDILVCD